LFSRFKEKLSGFKEALSSKIAEKVSLAEKLAGKKDDGKAGEGDNEIESQARALPEAGKSASQATSEKSSASGSVIAGKPKANAASAQPEKSAGESKPKSRFSFLEKAKSLIFEQEVILEEKDLEEPMWALEMALMESDVALPVAEEIVREVKSDLV